VLVHTCQRLDQDEHKHAEVRYLPRGKVVDAKLNTASDEVEDATLKYAPDGSKTYILVIN
jgi:hypothetical protein